MLPEVLKFVNSWRSMIINNDRKSRNNTAGKLHKAGMRYDEFEIKFLKTTLRPGSPLFLTRNLSHVPVPITITDSAHHQKHKTTG